MKKLLLFLFAILLSNTIAQTTTWSALGQGVIYQEYYSDVHSVTISSDNTKCYIAGRGWLKVKNTNNTEVELNGVGMYNFSENKYYTFGKGLKFSWYGKARVILELPNSSLLSSGGIVVGQEIACQLGKKFIFAERENKDLTLRRGFEISEGENVLVCEDVVTTGGSVFEVIDIVKSNGGNVAGVGMLVDRSNGKVNFGVPQTSTLQMEVVSYLPEECPMCKEGTTVVKPGSRKT